MYLDNPVVLYCVTMVESRRLYLKFSSQHQHQGCRCRHSHTHTCTLHSKDEVGSRDREGSIRSLTTGLVICVRFGVLSLQFEEGVTTLAPSSPGYRQTYTCDAGRKSGLCTECCMIHLRNISNPKGDVTVTHFHVMIKVKGKAV